MGELMSSIRIITRSSVVKLPAPQREAYSLWLEGRDEAEIAVLMNATRRRVVVWLYEARMELRGA